MGTEIHMIIAFRNGNDFLLFLLSNRLNWGLRVERNREDLIICGSDVQMGHVE